MATSVYPAKSTQTVTTEYKPAPRPKLNPWLVVGGAVVAYELLRRSGGVRLPFLGGTQGASPGPAGVTGGGAVSGIASAPPTGTPATTEGYLQLPGQPPAGAAPEPPMNLRMLGATAHSAIVGWDAVLGAASYEVREYPSGLLLTTSPTNMAVIEGLQANTDYEVYVVAVGYDGTPSPPSVPLLIRTTTEGPSATVTEITGAPLPQQPVTAPSLPAATAIGTPGAPFAETPPIIYSPYYAQVRIGWHAVAGATFYRLYHITGRLLAETSATSAVITVYPGADISLYVVACTDTGCSPPGPVGTVHVPSYAAAQGRTSPSTGHLPHAPSTVSVPEPPGAPYIVSVVYSSATTATVTVGWEGSAGATQYQLYHITSAGPQLMRRGPVSTTQVTLTGVPTNAYLSMAVRACNSAGCSALGPSARLYIPPAHAGHAASVGAVT